MVGAHPWTLTGDVKRPPPRFPCDDGSTQGYVWVRAGTLGATEAFGRVIVARGAAACGRSALAGIDGTVTLTSMVRVMVTGGAVTVTVCVDDVEAGLGVAVGWAGGGAGAGDE